MPWPFVAASHPLCQFRSHAAFHQFRVPLADGLPLLPEGASEPPPDPRVQVSEVLRGLAKAEISDPSHHIAETSIVCFMLRPRLTSVVSRTRSLNLAVLLALFAASARPCPCRNSIPETSALLRFRHRTLCLIYSQFQLVGNESLYALHYPLPRPLAAYVDIAIVRIPNKALAPRL